MRSTYRLPCELGGGTVHSGVFEPIEPSVVEFGDEVLYGGTQRDNHRILGPDTSGT